MQQCIQQEEKSVASLCMTLFFYILSALVHKVRLHFARMQNAVNYLRV